MPWQDSFIYATGILEMAFGVLLLPLRTRRFAAWGLVFLLIAIFPANIQMALNYREIKHPDIWLTVLRLPLQAVLIWWAYLFTQRAKPPK